MIVKSNYVPNTKLQTYLTNMHVFMSVHTRKNGISADFSYKLHKNLNLLKSTNKREVFKKI